MEKCCEFCKAIRPVVYCEADAAHLCLSCDAKIHSANTVFNRYLRTVLCEFCQARPTYVQCLDHRMFMCNACDRSQHTSSSSQHHRKRIVRSYTGCPPAKDFAALWGFQSSEIDNKTLSTSCGSCGSSVVNYDIDGQSCSQIECFSGGAQVTNEMGSSSKHYKIYYEGKEREETSFILHQILDLERLQLAEGNSPSAQSDLSSSAHHTSKNFDENLDWNSQPCEATGTNFQLKESPLQNLKDDPLPFPFSQQEQLPSESTMGLPLQTESIWPCRSPVQSSQLWSQNMQDLGICEELVHHDDFNIPDVDVTFRNFEELFGSDQDPSKLLVDDKDISYSSMERDMSLDKSDDRNSRAMVDTSEDSSMSLTQPADFDKDTIACNKVENVYHSHPIRPSSTLSFTPHPMTRISTVGDDADCHDTRPLSTSLDVDARQLEVRATSRMRYKEKKHSRLTEKKLPYPSRKANANVHNRGKGRIVKRE